MVPTYQPSVITTGNPNMKKTLLHLWIPFNLSFLSYIVFTVFSLVIILFYHNLKYFIIMRKSKSVLVTPFRTNRKRTGFCLIYLLDQIHFQFVIFFFTLIFMLYVFLVFQFLCLLKEWVNWKGSKPSSQVKSRELHERQHWLRCICFGLDGASVFEKCGGEISNEMRERIHDDTNGKRVPNF
jgi:hypothetical protein